MPSSEYDVLIVDWTQKYRNFVGVKKKIAKGALMVVFKLFTFLRWQQWHRKSHGPGPGQTRCPCPPLVSESGKGGESGRGHYQSG